MNKDIQTSEALFYKAMSMGLSFAACRMPNNQNIDFFTGELISCSLDKVQSKSFIIHTFQPDDSVWIIKDGLQDSGIKSLTNHSQTYHSISANQHITDREDYLNLVRRGINSIESGFFEKVVLARQSLSDLNNSFSPLKFFYLLAKTYPSLFVSMHSTPRFGTWIGATPELLLDVNRNSIKTMSLAGTRTASSIFSGQKFSGKEMTEQGIVSEYIRKVFDHLSLSYIESDIETFSTGELHHLKTIFEIKNTKKTKISELIRLLHPTPAICGYPKKAALSFINKEEAFDRELFGGYIGVIKDKQHASFYVNLRCTQIQNNKALFYAGAGIVKDSQPVHEWEETEQKMNTLRNLLK